MHAGQTQALGKERPLCVPHALVREKLQGCAATACMWEYHGLHACYGASLPPHHTNMHARAHASTHARTRMLTRHFPLPLPPAAQMSGLGARPTATFVLSGAQDQALCSAASEHSVAVLALVAPPRNSPLAPALVATLRSATSALLWYREEAGGASLEGLGLGGLKL